MDEMKSEEMELVLLKSSSPYTSITRSKTLNSNVQWADGISSSDTGIPGRPVGNLTGNEMVETFTRQSIDVGEWWWHRRHYRRKRIPPFTKGARINDGRFITEAVLVYAARVGETDDASSTYQQAMMIVNRYSGANRAQSARKKWVLDTNAKKEECSCNQMQMGVCVKAQRV